MSHGTVLITGASGAIGSALARAYATPGRRLVLHGRNAARLESLAQECESRGAHTETRMLDVRDTAALTTWLDATARSVPVDLAIANAGAIHVLRPGDVGGSREELERVIDVNVRATLATVGALLPHMRRRRSGQIAIMSSLLAWFGLPVAPEYSASKAALKAYGEALRIPLAREGIGISVVLPGFVRSPMSDELRIPKPFMMTAEEAASRIVAGLGRNRARISFPLPLAFGSWLLSALPQVAARPIIAWLAHGH
jgi:short-subunit dehydrogenase